jgi:hypothetical protein
MHAQSVFIVWPESAISASASGGASVDAAALAALHADARHWSESRVCGVDDGFYFCKADPRICVRKRNRVLSFTLNFGHPRALFVVVAFVVLVSLVPGAANAYALASQRRC